MPTTLVIRLCAPGQSWGTQSNFDTRDTGIVPSKTGIIGMLCSAGNIARDDISGIARVDAAYMAVRADNPGTIRNELQTAQRVPTTENKSPRTVMSDRAYIADGCFTVFLTYKEEHDAEDIHSWIRDPYRPLCYGRKKYSADGEITSHIIRQPKQPLHDIMSEWAGCPTHPVSNGDECLLVEDTKDDLWVPGVEEYPGRPVDFKHGSRKRKPRRTRTSYITIRLDVTNNRNPESDTHEIDFTTGEITTY